MNISDIGASQLAIISELVVLDYVICLILGSIGIFVVACVALRISDLGVIYVVVLFQSWLCLVIPSLLMLDSIGILWHRYRWESLTWSLPFGLLYQSWLYLIILALLSWFD